MRESRDAAASRKLCRLATAPMDPSRRIVLLLACCQALLLTNAVTLIAVASLVGYVLAANKALATLPSTAYVIGAAITALPASMWMRRVGRRNGFLTGGALGLTGAMLATFAVATGSFALLCAGMVLLGAYNSFGQYYRFAAADASPPDFKAKAISYVLAGGLAGGIIGPEVSRHTRGLLQPEYAATFASLVFFSLAAMAILAFLRMPPAADSRSHEPTRKLSEIARQPAFIVAVTVATLSYAVMNLLMTATPLAMSFCGHPYDAAAGVIASHVVAMFAPSFFTGALIKRFGVVRVMLAGLCALLPCGGAAPRGPQSATFWWGLGP